MEEIRLKEICNLENGYAFKSSDYVDYSNTLNCRMSNIRPDGSFNILYNAKYLPDSFIEKYKDYLLKDGDLIIAMTDMAGDPKILGVPTVVDTQGYNLLLNQRVGKLILFSNSFNVDYLKLALQSRKVRNYFKQFAGGGVQLNVGKKDILNAPIIVRQEKEQLYIATIFKTITELEHRNTEQLLLLDELIKSRFVEMFGDPILNSKNWNIITLKELTSKIGSGATPRGGRDSYKTEGISLIRSMNVHNNRFEYKDLAHISNEQADKLNNVIVQENDILLNITGASVARCCIVPSNVLPARVNQHVCIIRCAIDIIPTFISYLLTNEIFQKHLLDLAGSGATREAITKQQVEQLLIILPPLSLQNQFADFVAQVDIQRLKVKKSLEKLETLKKSLMQEYFG
ncbi:MAG: restriction endonuclease subunit S [Ruminococcus sp.]|nr:restriction endonuclease subunit S [Ruminococcus sp.]